MKRINREEALDIAKNNIGSLFQIEITDQWNADWPIYRTENLMTDCWYITLNPSLAGTHLGSVYLIVISKVNGSILWSGLVGK